MARVCLQAYPKGNYKGQRGDGFYIDDILKANLDIFLKNAGKSDDWDFVIVITGGGRVRVGKSLLALQIARYWIDQLEQRYGVKTSFNVEDNIVFHGTKLIEKGHKLFEKYGQGVLIFDEAGADLEGLKVMRRATQNVRDYLRECGQYNFLTIIVLPEYFDLPKGIAVTRSDCLINVYVSVSQEEKFIRGYFNYYSRPNKRQLYLRGKRELNYKAWRYDFHGRFMNFYPLEEEKYKQVKLKALLSRQEVEEEPKWKVQRDYLMYYGKKKGLTATSMANWMTKNGIKITQEAVSESIRGIAKVLELRK